MLVTGRKIRAQSVVPVQHSGWGSWEAWNDWAGLRVLRRIPSAFVTPLLRQQSHHDAHNHQDGHASERIVGRRPVDRGENPATKRVSPHDKPRAGLVVLPAAQKKPPPSTRPGGVRVAKCLPVNRDTRNVPPTTTCAVPPNEGSRRQTPPSSKDLGDASFPISLTRRQRGRDATLPP